MRRRQQQSRDVFDTGPFGSYNALGNTEGMIPSTDSSTLMP